MRLFPVPQEVFDHEREPDEVVEHVGPHGAQGKFAVHHAPEPADRPDRLAQKADHHQVRIAMQVARHDPVPIAVQPDAHTESAHGEGIVDGRQREQAKEEIRKQRDRQAPCDVIHRRYTEYEPETLFLQGPSTPAKPAAWIAVYSGPIRGLPPLEERSKNLRSWESQQDFGCILPSIRASSRGSRNGGYMRQVFIA